MFVAVWPDAATRARLAAVPLGPAGALRPVKPGQWHITLRFLGEVHPDLVPTLVGALETAAGTLPDPVPCQLGPATAWFGGDRVLQVPASGLDEVAVAVSDATVAIVPPVGPVGSRFTGHLTLARSKRRRLTAPERSALAGIPFASSFDADSFELVASQIGGGGPRYTTLARVPFRR